MASKSRTRDRIERYLKESNAYPPLVLREPTYAHPLYARRLYNTFYIVRKQTGVRCEMEYDSNHHAYIVVKEVK